MRTITFIFNHWGGLLLFFNTELPVEETLNEMAIELQVGGITF
jgi:hypothetical protein